MMFSELPEEDQSAVDLGYMQEAFRQALKAGEADEVPVGAVVVHKNRIVARAHNQVETLKDPTAHAEMIALTQAANTLQQKWLLDCTMYVTLEPCAMCAGASVLARLKRIVYATPDPKTGACGSVFLIANTDKCNHRCEISSGPMAWESSSLLKDYFMKKRERA